MAPPEGEHLSPLLMARQATYRGFGDALAMAFEMVMTPLLFGLGGYGLDRWLATSPVFTVVLSLLAIIGMSARMWYGYDARMRAHEAAGPWAKTSSDTAVTPAERERP
ncbi:MAG: AtpZ/AtpI family protein [Acidimicrobiales bacterium]